MKEMFQETKEMKITFNLKSHHFRKGKIQKTACGNQNIIIKLYLLDPTLSSRNTQYRQHKNNSYRLSSTYHLPGTGLGTLQSQFLILKAILWEMVKAVF